MWWWIEKLIIIVGYFLAGGFSAYALDLWKKSEKK